MSPLPDRLILQPGDRTASGPQTLRYASNRRFDPETRQRLHLSQEQSLAMVVVAAAARNARRMDIGAGPACSGVARHERCPRRPDVRRRRGDADSSRTRLGLETLIESGVDVAVRRQTTAAELLRVLLGNTLSRLRARAPGATPSTGSTDHPVGTPGG